MSEYSKFLTLLIPFSLAAQTITTDQQALEYCKTNTNTRLLLVWPRGYKHTDFIAKEFESLGDIFYIKEFELTQKEGSDLLFSLYDKESIAIRKVHEYFPANFSTPYFLSMIFLQTNESLRTIKRKKRAIRRMLGARFYALHSTDYHSETIELAEYILES